MAEAKRELQEQEKLARDALARRDAAEARSNALNKAFNSNVERIAELTQLLRQHEGNLGELFGVTRHIAGDSANGLQQSMLTVQYPAPEGEEDRAEFLVRLAAVKSLPSMPELERMWFELQREMTENGKVARFTSSVLQQDGSSVEAEVVRVGPFTAIADGSYVAYSPSKKSLTGRPCTIAQMMDSLADQLMTIASAEPKLIPLRTASCRIL